MLQPGFAGIELGDETQPVWRLRGAASYSQCETDFKRGRECDSVVARRGLANGIAA